MLAAHSPDLPESSTSRLTQHKPLLRLLSTQESKKSYIASKGPYTGDSYTLTIHAVVQGQCQLTEPAEARCSICDHHPLLVGLAVVKTRFNQNPLWLLLGAHALSWLAQSAAWRAAALPVPHMHCLLLLSLLCAALNGH